MPISQITNNSISPSAAIEQSKVSGLGAIVDTTAFNIALLGFKMSITESLTVFNLVDGMVDEFESESGVDTSASTNESYDSTNDWYINQSSTSYNATYTPTAIGGPGAPFGIAAATPGPAPASFGSLTVPSGTTSVTAYTFGAGGGGSGIGGAPTIYNFGVGGGGGLAIGTIATPGGVTLRVGVGTGGADSGGFRNGGNGYPPGAPGPFAPSNAKGGGGLVGVFSTTYGSISAPTAYVIAGSGGGGYASVFSGGLGQYNGADGGGAGGTQGKRGGDQSETTNAGPYTYQSQGNLGSISGGGGSQSAGGTGGSGPAATGTSGSLFTGGPGASSGGGAGYYGGGAGGFSPGSEPSNRGGGSGGGGSSYTGHPLVTSASTTGSQPGPAGGSPLSGGAPSPFYSPGVGVGGTGPGTPAPGHVAGGDGYVVLAWTDIPTATMTLISSAFTAKTAPTRVRMVVFQETASGSPTLNTDIVGSVSRDNGTTYTNVTLVDSAYVTGSSGLRILTGTADISAQPSGTSMRWKVVVNTNSVSRIHGVSIQWS
jgi:hypothetical protein